MLIRYYTFIHAYIASYDDNVLVLIQFGSWGKWFHEIRDDEVLFCELVSILPLHYIHVHGVDHDNNAATGKGAIADDIHSIFRLGHPVSATFIAIFDLSTKQRQEISPRTHSRTPLSNHGSATCDRSKKQAHRPLSIRYTQLHTTSMRSTKNAIFTFSVLSLARSPLRAMISSTANEIHDDAHVMMRHTT